MTIMQKSDYRVVFSREKFTYVKDIAKIVSLLVFDFK